MALIIFSLIAWLTITVLLLIPRKLDEKENILLFFLLTILIISFFTVLDLNLHLIESSKRVELFLGLWVHRNLILPVTLIIFLNLWECWESRYRKIGITLLTFGFLFFTEQLAVALDIKKYTGWNRAGSLLSIIAFMIIAYFLKSIISGIPRTGERS